MIYTFKRTNQIYVKFANRLGNNIFQLSAALYLKKTLFKNDATIILSDKRLNNLFNLKGFKYPNIIEKIIIHLFFRYKILTLGFEKYLLGQKLPPLDSLSKFNKILLQGLFINQNYMHPIKDDLSNLLLFSNESLRSGNTLTIHIRCKESDTQSNLPDNPDYPMLPFSFYEKIISSEKWDEIFVVAAKDKDPFVQKLKIKYNAKVISQNPLNDFLFLMQSSNIVLSVSTFAWTAAYLSSAKKVFYPRTGMFLNKSPLREDLELKEDKRFRIFDVSTPNPWTASTKQIEEMLNS